LRFAGPGWSSSSPSWPWPSWVCREPEHSPSCAGAASTTPPPSPPGPRRSSTTSSAERRTWSCWSGLPGAAAFLLAVSFFAFGTAKISFMQMFGLGSGLAVLIDALAVRGVLVPAAMRLLGLVRARLPSQAPRPVRPQRRRPRTHGRCGTRNSDVAVCEGDDGSLTTDDRVAPCARLRHTGGGHSPASAHGCCRSDSDATTPARTPRHTLPPRRRRPPSPHHRADRVREHRAGRLRNSRVNPGIHQVSTRTTVMNRLTRSAVVANRRSPRGPSRPDGPASQQPPELWILSAQSRPNRRTRRHFQ
jgi:hypothetical protein